MSRHHPAWLTPAEPALARGWGGEILLAGPLAPALPRPQHAGRADGAYPPKASAPELGHGSRQPQPQPAASGRHGGEEANVLVQSHPGPRENSLGSVTTTHPAQPCSRPAFTCFRCHGAASGFLFAAQREPAPPAGAGNAQAGAAFPRGCNLWAHSKALGNSPACSQRCRDATATATRQQGQEAG